MQFTHWYLPWISAIVLLLCSVGNKTCCKRSSGINSYQPAAFFHIMHTQKHVNNNSLKIIAYKNTILIRIRHQTTFIMSFRVILSDILSSLNVPLDKQTCWAVPYCELCRWLPLEAIMCIYMTCLLSWIWLAYKSPWLLMCPSWGYTTTSMFYRYRFHLWLRGISINVITKHK